MSKLEFGMHAHELCWAELDAYVSRLRQDPSKAHYFKVIEGKPTTKESVTNLVADGLEIRFAASVSGGRYSPKSNHGFVISINTELTGYDRDITIFHELTHAILGDRFLDLHPNPAISFERNALVEWVARRARADPDLLEHVYKTFNLSYMHYDAPSREVWVNRLLTNPGSQLRLNFKPTLMD